MLNRILTAILTILLLAMPAIAAQQPAGGQDEFVAVDELPASEQLPAAPLVIGAYAFVWIVLMVYLWSIWRRLGKVEADIRALEQRRRGSAR